MGDQGRLTNSSIFKAAPKYSFTSQEPPKDNRQAPPGPGKYTVLPADKDKFVRSASWTIGGTSRDGGKESEAMPGPGAYTPLKTDSGAKYGFTQSDRLRPLKKSVSPGPGQYSVMGASDGFKASIASKPEGPKGGTTPGPGAYKPSFSQSSAFGSSRSISFSGTGRAGLRLSKTPGPGAYDQLTSLGGNIAMRGVPKYSIKTKHSPPKADLTPGPGSAQTQFK
uniref:Uncharacterized protein n=1 Tax=Strombidinopsis acuminata TaxID=141414 RepID=A0A7S3VY99_9SPIT